MLLCWERSNGTLVIFRRRRKDSGKKSSRDNAWSVLRIRRWGQEGKERAQTRFQQNSPSNTAPPPLQEQEKERIKEEYAEISSYLERLREKRRHAAQERIQAEDWEHCKQCSHLPLVSSRAQRNDYRKYISDAPGETVEELLSQVSACVG